MTSKDDPNISATIHPNGSVTLSGICMQARSESDLETDIVKEFLSRLEEDCNKRKLMAFCHRPDSELSSQSLSSALNAAVLVEKIEMAGDAVIIQGRVLSTPNGVFLSKLLKLRHRKNARTDMRFRTLYLGRDVNGKIQCSIVIDSLPIQETSLFPIW